MPLITQITQITQNDNKLRKESKLPFTNTKRNNLSSLLHTFCVIRVISG